MPWDAEAPAKNPYAMDDIDERAMKNFIERANAIGRIDFWKFIDQCG
jgi:hypothetical protein